MLVSLFYLLGGLFLFIMIGIPVAFAIGNISLISFIVERGIEEIPFTIVAQRILYGVRSFPLLAVPFFLFAGKLMNTGGITKRIFEFADYLVGFLRGGLMHANIVASMIFAGMSGSGVADAAGLGAIEIAAMDEAGYDRDLAIGVTAASSGLGPIIPPSTMLVIFAISAGQSVAKLLIGGIVPGVMLGLLFMIFADFLAMKRKLTPSHRFPRLKKIFQSFKTTGPSLLTPVIILGGIMGGFFTPTEAAAVACLYALILSGLIYKELSLRKIFIILKEVARDTSVIMIIISAASLYGWILIRQRIPYYLAEMLLGITENPFVILLIFDVFFIVVGCFMSGTVSVIIFTPILLPIIQEFGISPIHFGVVMVYVLSVGNITPPFGQVLFVLTRITGEKFEFVLRSVLPWYIPRIAGMLIVTYIPFVSTWLPNMLWD